MKKMTIGNFELHPVYKVPSLSLLLDGVIYGYLSPFRGYFFQISKTFDGEHSLGRSENVTTIRNLSWFLNDNSEVEYDTFNALAREAVHNAIQIYGGLNDEFVKFDKSNVYSDPWSQWKQFIDESIKWVRENC